MKKLLLLLLIMATAATCMAKYVVHSVSGSVTLQRAGKTQPLAKGTELGGVDNLVLAQGAAVEILNTADNKVYRCDKAGKFTAMKIMMNARRSSDNKFSSIASTTRFGSGGKKAGTVYEEGCLVTRALGSYDPEGATTQVDASQLAISMANMLNGNLNDSIPTPLTHGTSAKGEGLEFCIDNTFEYPLYVNVVKFGKAENNARSVKISELGQPVGCYILLPGQSLMRRHSMPLDSTEEHLLILTRGYFDIDEVIEKASAMSGTPDQPMLGAGHIYITKL